MVGNHNNRFQDLFPEAKLGISHELSKKEIAKILLAGDKAHNENIKTATKPQEHYDFCNKVHMRY